MGMHISFHNFPLRHENLDSDWDGLQGNGLGFYSNHWASHGLGHKYHPFGDEYELWHPASGLWRYICSAAYWSLWSVSSLLCCTCTCVICLVLLQDQSYWQLHAVCRSGYGLRSSPCSWYWVLLFPMTGLLSRLSDHCRVCLGLCLRLLVFPLFMTCIPRLVCCLIFHLASYTNLIVEWPRMINIW